ncbi:MAG: NAD-dependent epimerase/dehydratase family protein [Zoogloea sp.]|nr:NAD-dependent epimerase/dehydratase family protein [Zoogloea sp.]MDD3352217.1 NAD-dependent epimerase/dehydratase family protein [Zoogloea sp.]
MTGGRGFIGRRLVTRLAAQGTPLRVLTRGRPHVPHECQGDLAEAAALAVACGGVRRVVHCAGHAHAFGAFGPAEVQRHWRVNFEGTRHLAEAAGRAGVGRFVFLSSVKAVGEPGEACADEEWPLPPVSDYGRAKRAAEEALLETGQRYGMEVVILRPAMVYGAGGRGNLERMAALIRRGFFPPLPETGNRRSLVHVSDLVAAIELALTAPQAAGRTYTVAHAQAPSGRGLYDALRAVLGLPPLGWAVPRPLLVGLARLGDVGEVLMRRRLPFDKDVLERLLGSACHSPARIACELGWEARVGLAEGLEEMLHGR